MRIRSLASDGDWIFGSGKSAYANGDKAILLNIATTLKTFLGECFFDTAMGMPWFDLIDQRNKDVVMLFIKSAITELYGVLEVNELEYTIDSDRKLTLKYYIKTMFTESVLGTVII
jgi:hypothetical protein